MNNPIVNKKIRAEVYIYGDENMTEMDMEKVSEWFECLTKTLEKTGAPKDRLIWTLFK